MSLIVALKFFHYLSLFLAGGLGVANALLVKAHQKAGMPPAPPVQHTMLTLARLGLVALVILWVTGIILTDQLYGSFNLGWAFHLKLLGATILLLVIAFLNIHLATECQKRHTAKSENHGIDSLYRPYIIGRGLDRHCHCDNRFIGTKCRHKSDTGRAVIWLAADR